MKGRHKSVRRSMLLYWNTNSESALYNVFCHARSLQILLTVTDSSSEKSFDRCRKQNTVGRRNNSQVAVSILKKETAPEQVRRCQWKNARTLMLVGSDAQTILLPATPNTNGSGQNYFASAFFFGCVCGSHIVRRMPVYLKQATAPIRRVTRYSEQLWIETTENVWVWTGNLAESSTATSASSKNRTGKARNIYLRYRRWTVKQPDAEQIRTFNAVINSLPQGSSFDCELSSLLHITNSGNTRWHASLGETMNIE